MGRHQMGASSSARARVALGALPLVATVGAIGVGSVVMSPPAAEAPLERPAAGVGAAAPLHLAPAVPGPPVAVLDLASTGGPVADDPIVPDRTVGTASAGRGEAEAAPRRGARMASASSGSARTAVRDADTPTGASSGGGTVDRRDAGGGSSGGSRGSGGSSGSGGSGGSGASDSGGSGGSGGGRGGGGGLLGGVVGGLGQSVSGATSLLSFGESSSSVLSFGS